MKQEDKPSLQEIMTYFNGLNRSYRGHYDGPSAESRAASAKAFHNYKSWLQEHGIKVRLAPQGVWVIDEEVEGRT